MGIILGSNFDVQTNLPLDSRDVVADQAARDAIDSLRRYRGMKCFVIADEKLYWLKSGITNADWEEFASGSGSGFGGKNLFVDPTYTEETTETRGYRELSFTNDGSGGFTDGASAGFILAFPSHGLTEGQRIFYYTDGQYLDGATNLIGVEGYVVGVLDTDTFGISLTEGGSKVPLSDGAGVGSTHYFRIYETPAHFTLAIETDNPLVGTTGSLGMAFNNDASSAVGEGYELNTNAIDREDRGKLHFLKTSVNASHDDYAGNDLVYRVIDKTNSKLINIYENYQILQLETGYVTPVQTETTTENLLVSVHCAQDTASADYGLAFGTFSLGPDRQVPVPISTLPQTYTPTGSITTNATYTGAWVRRPTGEIEVQVTMAMSGTNTQGDWTFTVAQLFNGLGSLTVDVAKLSGAASSNDLVAIGFGGYEDSGSANRGGLTVWYQKSTGLIKITGASFSDITPASNTPITIASGDSFSFKAVLPIVEWQSSAMLSTTELSNKGVVAIYTMDTSTANATISASSVEVLDYNVKIKDTHNAVTTGASWKFTAPVTADYFISAHSSIAGMATGKMTDLRIYKNGVTLVDLSGRISTSVVSEVYGPSTPAILIPLEKDETLEVRINNGDASDRLLDCGTGMNRVSIWQHFDPTSFSVYGQIEDFESVNSSNIAITASLGNWTLASGWTLAVPAGRYDLSLRTVLYATAASGTLFGEVALATSATPGTDILASAFTNQFLASGATAFPAQLESKDHVFTEATTLYVHVKVSTWAGGSTQSGHQALRNDAMTGGGVIHARKYQ